MLAGSRVLTLTCGLIWATAAFGAGALNDLPDPRLTPGATNPAVTEATIGSTICRRGWTRTVRPPVSYTEPLKRRLMNAYGYAGRRLRDFELDHLIPLELGGAPADPRNLWPEPWREPWGAHVKDRLENALRREVCAGALPLAEAQRMIATDWERAYCRIIGGAPC